MPYNSQIQFTLDTICPWTYLAKRRLDKALSQLPPDCPVTFTVVYKPYQLYPDAPLDGEDKFEWYKKTRYGDSDEKMSLYTQLMSAYGRDQDIAFKFGGTIANTLHAHRVIRHFQDSKGPDVAGKLVTSLYRQYFEEEKHPSSDETLVAAATEAGIDAQEARDFVEDRDAEVLDTKMLIREQAGNGIDAVPYIVVEGKRRDVTLEGAREVNEYVKALNTVIRESS
jgi:predicted DsbA family dithiol-disulfide isomerase